MALEPEELNRRRRLREEQRKKRRQAQRRLYFRLAAAAVALLLSGVGIFLLIRGNAPEEPELSGPTAPPTEATQPPTEEEENEAWSRDPSVIHIAAAGDLNVTDQVVWAGQTAINYDYTKAFMDVAPILSEADLAILNFEGIVSGTPYGTASTSAPVEMIQALKSAGVDLLQMANSCTVNNGVNGLVTTLANIRSAGIEPVGAFSGDEEFNRSKGYTVCEVGDIKIVFVAFTKGLGGRGLPVGSENCVNLLYKDYSTTYREIDTDGIRKVLRAAANEDPDITIAMLHWGSEFNDEISKSQNAIAELMMDEGVDAILGTHAHLVQKIEYDQSSGQLIAYSLGDFFGDAGRSGTNYSIILDLEITKDYDTGVTKITDYSYTPIYTLSEKDCDGDRRVVRISNAMSAWDMNFVDKITDSCYSAMEYALKRIAARVAGE